MLNNTEKAQAIINKFDKVVENVVVMDFTKSQVKVVTEPQRVYQFPEEIGHMLLSLYKEKLQYASFDSIKRGLISDVREQNNMIELNKVLIEFMEKREFIDNVVNDTLDTYKTENFVEPTAVKADLPTMETYSTEEKKGFTLGEDGLYYKNATPKSDDDKDYTKGKFSHLP